MRFNDRNTALHLLGSKNNYTVAIPTESVGFSLAVSFLDTEFDGMKPLFRKSIQYLCKPFLDAYLKAQVSLYHALEKEPIHKSGTLIYTSGVGSHLTTFYDLDTKHNGKELIANGTIVTFSDVPNTSNQGLVFLARIKDNEAVGFQPLTHVERFDGKVQINIILCMLLFIKYCPVETKIIAKGKKVSHSHEEYLNKTKLPIEILDSTWFTTIVRSEGFSVGGHFRLQPYGPGRTDRKLIWIEGYEKQGYVRKAGVLRATDGLTEQEGDLESSGQ
jgi:hypothetical protein